MPRGDADGRSPDDYVPGIKNAGAMNIERECCRTASQVLIEALRRFRRACYSTEQAR
jgi:hypothetical protein